jgi:hypothetical protein
MTETVRLVGRVFRDGDGSETVGERAGNGAKKPRGEKWSFSTDGEMQDQKMEDSSRLLWVFS